MELMNSIKHNLIVRGITKSKNIITVFILIKIWRKNTNQTSKPILPLNVSLNIRNENKNNFKTVFNKYRITHGTFIAGINYINRFIIKSITSLAIILFINISYACEKLNCNSCQLDPEHTWNPKNEFVTADLKTFYSLEEIMNSAFSSGSYEKAKSVANQYLKLAEKYRCNWNYGNAIHNANSILGLISLENGEDILALEFLHNAGKSTGSPQLDSFGPELYLANELIRKGYESEVKSYLTEISRFWTMNNGLISQWIEEIDSGELPVLDKYSQQQGLIGKVLLFGALLFPVIITIFYFFLLRKRITKKWTFVALGIVIGYALMILTNFFVSFSMAGTLSMLSQVNSKYVFIGATYVILSLVFLVPFLSIHLLSKKFIEAEK